MKKNDEAPSKLKIIFVLTISALMFIFSFIHESQKKYSKDKEINTVVNKNNTVISNSIHVKVLMDDGDTIDAIVMGRKVFLGEVVMITDTVKEGGYLIK